LPYIGGQGKYETEGVEYLNFKIDGYWLDEKLISLFPNYYIPELLPSLLYKFDRPIDAEIVQENILPKDNETTICPIYTCEQGCGVTCHNVVAEIENDGYNILWKRFGVLIAESVDYYKIKETYPNAEFLWFEDKTLSYCFKKKDYIEMLETFRVYKEIEEKKR
jgi:hypothetical protein